MAKVIEVIFTETRKGQFQIGQQKNVKSGYARNYLLPQKLAVLVTEENLQQISSLKRKATKKLDEIKGEAEALKKIIDGKSVNFKVKTHDEGKLYGSISAQDIADIANKDFKVSLDKHDVGLPQPIKEAGKYNIQIRLHKDVAIAISVTVERDEESQKKIEKANKDREAREAAKAAAAAEEEAAEAESEEVTAETSEVTAEESVEEEAVEEEAKAEVEEKVKAKPKAKAKAKAKTKVKAKVEEPAATEESEAPEAKAEEAPSDSEDKA